MRGAHSLMLFIWITSLSIVTEARASEEVHIYSARQEVLFKPLLESFTAETGVEVKIVSAKADALLERLNREGINSPADILLTVDAGRLARAKEMNLLQSAHSITLEKVVPSAYRDPTGFWFGLSLRARPIIYAKERVQPESLSSYADLADPKWHGSICVRSSSNVYNQSMLAGMIVRSGVETAEAWVRGLVSNFARSPQGGDRDQIRAVASGECDLALANTYYLARMANSDDEDDRAVAEKVSVFWPDQEDHGVHVNVSGAGITKYAPNRANAVKFLEFLVSRSAQKMYADVVNEYPVVEGVRVSDVVSSWGTFKADDLNLVMLGIYNPDAVRIADRAGWK